MPDPGGTSAIPIVRVGGVSKLSGDTGHVVADFDSYQAAAADAGLSVRALKRCIAATT